jgi:hypothetical protein
MCKGCKNKSCAKQLAGKETSHLFKVLLIGDAMNNKANKKKAKQKETTSA